MSDTEVLKLVFGLMLGSGTVALLIIAFATSYKYMVQEKRCTAKTRGVVKRYAQTPGNGIFLPKVHYTVDGREYKVIGPRYRYYVKKIKSSPLTDPMSGENAWFYETEKQGFVVNWNLNSFLSIKGNPMKHMYPIGTEIDVYYDPNKPKLAYVLRYCNLRWVFWLLIGGAIFTFLTMVLILVAPM